MTGLDSVKFVKNMKIYSNNKVKSFEKKLCTCKILFISAFIAKLCGLFPYQWKHKNKKCLYEKSTFWIIYSIFIVIILTVVSIYSFKNIKLDSSNLPEFLNTLSNLLYSTYRILIIIALVQLNAGEDFLNKLVSLDRDHLFCQSSRKISKNIMNKVKIMNISAICGQFLIIWYLGRNSDDRVMIWNILVSCVLQVWPFTNSDLWTAIINYYISNFICFETILKNYLQYQPIHPIQKFDFTNNKGQFLGFLGSYKICSGQHNIPISLMDLDRPELLDYLRTIHEELYQNVHLYFSYGGAQFFFQLILELVLLSASSYSVAIYTVYGTRNLEATVMFLANLGYAIYHSCGLFWVLKDVQTLKNTVSHIKYFNPVFNQSKILLFLI
ncbi:uncharacterized protein LOC115885319 [Sitophilus oryzae]|uniref:Uncharacterized protein LOC115885319 n=1 Tax=Sitophilus oryzae TaxID=7048 RepID=A0A6J2YAU8_SITOR|nr:uncharacterized protein LOC115885319 [Sitophilus oryzae]